MIKTFNKLKIEENLNLVKDIYKCLQHTLYLIKTYQKCILYINILYILIDYISIITYYL